MKYILPIIGFAILLSCQEDDQKKWAELKKSGEVYPSEKLDHFTDTLLMGDTREIWINKNYHSYPHYYHCPNKIELTLYKSDSLIARTFEESPQRFANYALKEFRYIGVTHYVAQIADSSTIKIVLYTEEDVNSLMILAQLDIPFEANVSDDEDWFWFKNFKKQLE